MVTFTSELIDFSIGVKPYVAGVVQIVLNRFFLDNGWFVKFQVGPSVLSVLWKEYSALILVDWEDGVEGIIVGKVSCVRTCSRWQRRRNGEFRTGRCPTGVCSLVTFGTSRRQCNK